MGKEKNKPACPKILRAMACHEQILFALRCSIHLDFHSDMNKLAGPYPSWHYPPKLLDKIYQHVPAKHDA